MPKTNACVRKIISAILLSAVLMSTGCGNEISPVTDNGTYATQQRMTSMEYSIYMNKQMTVVAGHLLSRMTAIENARSVTGGTDEVALAKESLKQVQSVLESIRTAYPSVGGENKRQAAIVAVSSAEHNISDYISDLEQGKDVSDYKKIFQTCYNEVTQCGDAYA